jgi:glucoamylase
VRRNLEIYTRRRPIQKVTAGDTLRIIDEDLFEVVWSRDGWKSTHHTPCRSLGSSGFSADIEIPATATAGELSWTLQWTGKGRWLGYNVQVKIESDSTSPLNQGNQERIEQRS